CACNTDRPAPRRSPAPVRLQAISEKQELQSAWSAWASSAATRQSQRSRQVAGEREQGSRGDGRAVPASLPQDRAIRLCERIHAPADEDYAPLPLRLALPQKAGGVAAQREKAHGRL